jgi:hypothetical protein
MVDPSSPLKLMMRSQRAATSALTDAMGALREVPTAGVTPDQAMHQLIAAAQALAGLAVASIKPMQELIERQRELGETMSTFAAAHRHSADVLDSLAKNQAAVVEAMETLFLPVIAAEKAIKSADRSQSTSKSRPTKRTAKS